MFPKYTGDYDMSCDRMCISGKLVIFSQSPTDVQYVVSLYENYHRQCRIIIVVVGIKTNYHFLKSLGLENVNLHFINTNIHWCNLFNLWTIKRNLYQLYGQLIRNGNMTACFFSNYFDYYTFYLVVKLSDQHQVYMIDIYNVDEKLVSNIGLIKKIKSWLLRFFFKIDFYYIYTPGGLIATLPLEYYSILRLSCKPDHNAILKYSYKCYIETESILLLESGPILGVDTASYNNILKSIVEILIKNGFKIYVKPHPRVGYSTILNQYDIVVLPRHIPFEFIDAREFSFVIGGYTTALAKLPRKTESKPVCIGGMFRYYEESDKELHRKYLNNLPGVDEIVFADNLAEFEDIVSVENPRSFPKGIPILFEV